MVRRILLSASRVAVSRPGYDVITAAVNPDTMSVDSTFGLPLRLLQAGVLLSRSINGFGTVGYGTTYSTYPKVLILPWDGGAVIINLFQKRTNGSTHDSLYFNPYNVKMGKSSFKITRNDGNEGQFDDAYYNAARHWIYLVFPP